LLDGTLDERRSATGVPRGSCSARRRRRGSIRRTVGTHSIRAGFATTAPKKGKNLDARMRQTLHRSEQVARGYIRDAKLFDDHAAMGLV
jgi:hypothetical protein